MNISCWLIGLSAEYAVHYSDIYFVLFLNLDIFYLEFTRPETFFNLNFYFMKFRPTVDHTCISVTFVSYYKSDMLMNSILIDRYFLYRSRTADM